MMRLYRLLFVLAVPLLLGLVGCDKFLTPTISNRTPLHAVYRPETGIDITNAQHLLRDRYILFGDGKNRVKQVAFDMRTKTFVWRTQLFDHAYYSVTENSRYAYAWPFTGDNYKRELVLLEPSSGKIRARLSWPELEDGEGALAYRYTGVVASETRVYTAANRSSVAYFDLDDEGMPILVRKATIPDIEEVVTPTRGQLFRIYSITMDPDTQDVFVGADSYWEYGDIPDLYRLDAETGEILWKAHVEYPDNGEDAVAGRYAGHVSVITLAGDVLIVQAGQSVQAFDPETGKRYWYYELRCEGMVPGGGTESQLYVPETGRVYFGRDSQSCFYSVAASPEGPDPWTLDTQDYPYGATPQDGLPTYLDGVLYFYNGFLWAVDPYAGKPLSVSEKVNATGWAISLFNDGEYIYVPDDEGIYAFVPLKKK